jgi:hypothetical protein
MQAYFFFAMNTSFVHIISSILPLFCAGLALLVMGYGSLRNSERAIRVALILLIVNGVITTFSSAMGGVSLRMVKSIPGINEATLSLHAWTGSAAFLISLLITGLSIFVLRSGNYTRKGLNRIFILILFFLIIFVSTTLIAMKIR